MSAQLRNNIDDLILQRVCGEFLEMPGLRLTGAQAQRLWGLDERSCRQLLEYLVDAKFLCRTGRGMYMRLTEGHADCPRPRAAAAGPDIVRKELKEAV